MTTNKMAAIQCDSQMSETSATHRKGPFEEWLYGEEAGTSLSLAD